MNIGSPWKEASLPEAKDAAKYVVCATDPDESKWTVFRPKDQSARITDEQVYATVKAKAGFAPGSYNFIRVNDAMDARDAAGKALGAGLAYQHPDVVRHKKGFMDAERIASPKGHRDPVKEGMDMAAMKEIFGPFWS